MDGNGHWQVQFEQMCPSDLLDCRAYIVLGNHDYQYWPDKVEAQLEYARRRTLFPDLDIKQNEVLARGGVIAA